MNPRLLAALILSIAIAAIAFAYGGERAAPVPSFVSPEVLISLGHAQATTYALCELPPVKRSHTYPHGAVQELEVDVLRGLEDARAAVVRLALSHDEGGVSHTSNGSGVLVEGGRFVLTAGHVVGDVPDPANADIRAYLPQPRLAEGRDLEFEARVVDWRYGNDDQGVPQDWALLEVIGPRDGMPSVPIAAEACSTVLFCYGFPTQLGVDARGRAVLWTQSRCLAPVLTVVEPSAADPMGIRMPLFEPLAGSLTYGGQSGGPLFDASGAVVNVISGNNTWWKDGQHTHRIRAASLDAARAALELARK